jgi:hypothetical protein
VTLDLPYPLAAIGALELECEEEKEGLKKRAGEKCGGVMNPNRRSHPLYGRTRSVYGTRPALQNCPGITARRSTTEICAGLGDGR